MMTSEGCVKFFQILTFLVVFSAVAANIPSYIKVCKRNDPKISECIKNSILELRPKLKEGIPELQVPPLEPLLLDEVKLRSGPSSAKIDANFTNLMVDGPSQFEIVDLRINIPKNRFLIRINLPEIRYKGNYDIDMNVLVLKYKGQGPINGNFTNMKADVKLQGHIQKNNGKDYLKFENFDIKLYIEKSFIRLDGLFQRDPILGRATNEVVNENSELFINEIRPSLEQALSEKFTSIGNIITKSFTYEELFPEA